MLNRSQKSAFYSAKDIPEKSMPAYHISFRIPNAISYTSYEISNTSFLSSMLHGLKKHASFFTWYVNVTTTSANYCSTGNKS